VLEVKLDAELADCLSILGLAREVAAITGYRAPATRGGARLAAADAAEFASRTRSRAPRFFAAASSRASTPARRRQRGSGSASSAAASASISAAIVDVTNYVML
jgi:phenylalanyl-tRNA synthetase beta subunit